MHFSRNIDPFPHLLNIIRDDEYFRSPYLFPPTLSQPSARWHFRVDLARLGWEEQLEGTQV